MSTPLTRRKRRLIASSTLAVTAALSLTSCFGFGPGGGGPGAGAVSDVQAVKSAVMRFTGQGTFIEPGTLDPSEQAWIGTGWFMSPDGYAVTNNHVVTGAGTLKVHIGGDDKQEYSAQLVSASECYDLAVVKVDIPQQVPFLSWYDGDITEGVEVFSAGFPTVLGAEYTLTKGIVSQADVKLASPWADLEHVIEHDARIRGGNSGGPLVSSKAQVLGINYAGSDESDSNYAISRVTAKDIIAKLKNGEQMLTLGINAQAMPPSESGQPQGIWVASVKSGGAADKAGLKPGDVIDKLGGVTMGEQGTIAGYCDVLRTHGLENAIDVQVWRPSTSDILEGQVNGKPLQVTGNTGSGGGTSTTGSFVDIANNGKTIAVTVPNTWKEIDGAPYTDANGVSWEYLEASPSISSFQDGWTTPGIIITAAPKGKAQPKALLDELNTSFASQCTATSTSQSFADGYATGLYSEFSNCGGSGTTVLVAAAETDDGTAVFRLVLQLTTNDPQEVHSKVTESYFITLK